MAAPFYSGAGARVILWTPTVSLLATNPLANVQLVDLDDPIFVNPEGTDRTIVFTPFPLQVHKFTITNRTQEEDITCARVPAAFDMFGRPTGVALLPDPGRLFVASNMPRVDLVLEGFWMRTDDPFGTGVALHEGWPYRMQIYFAKDRPIPNWDGNIYILGLEVTGSTRDVVRFTLSGVLNGNLVPIPADGPVARYWPLP